MKHIKKFLRPVKQQEQTSCLNKNNTKAIKTQVLIPNFTRTEEFYEK